MFITILLKEIEGSLRSPRFMLGALAMLALIVAAALLLAADVERRYEAKATIEKSQEEYVSNYAHMNRIEYVLRPDRPIEASELMVRGLDNSRENTSFFDDPLRKLFPQLDLIFIVSVVLSLLAVIFSYDSICGERQDGTLKLIHTGRVSRATVLLAKWTAALLMLAVPFAAILLLGLLLGTALSPVALESGLILEAALIGLGAVVYLSFFVALGLLVSSLVRNPGTSILVLLLLWVVFVLGVPNASPILASQLLPIASVNTVEREARLLTDTVRDRRLDEERVILAAEVRDEFGIPDGVNFRDTRALIALGWSGDQVRSFMEESTRRFRAMLQRVNEEQSAKADALHAELERQVRAQQELAQAISLLSPASSFTFLAADIASQGVRAEEYVAEEMSRYAVSFEDFMVARRDRIERERGTPVSWEEFIDLTGRPRFTHKPEPLEARLSRALPFAGHLVFMVLVALTAAFVAYLRYDIR